MKSLQTHSAAHFVIAYVHWGLYLKQFVTYQFWHICCKQGGMFVHAPTENKLLARPTPASESRTEPCIIDILSQPARQGHHQIAAKL